MSIFTTYGKYIRLGAQNFQPLGSWPVTNDAGGRGASGSSQPAAVVPTNVSGFYTRRRSTTPQETTTISDVRPGNKPNVN